MTTSSFNQTSQKNNTATFDYENEVTAIWKNFPALQDKVLFINLCGQSPTLVYPGDPEKKEEIRQSLNHREELLYTVRDLRYMKSSTSMGYRQEDITFILLYTEETPSNRLANSATTAQETTFTFDHEMGHALIQEAGPDYDQFLSECIGDVYATIRHFQRYGADSKAIDGLPLMRAFTLFDNDDIEHFTGPLIEKLVAQRDTTEWNSMTPEETRQFARTFTLQNFVTRDELEPLREAFQICSAMMEDLRTNETTSFELLAETVFESNNPDVVKWGSSVLNLALDGALTQRYGITLTGETWDNIRQKLTKKQPAQQKLNHDQPKL